MFKGSANVGSGEHFMLVYNNGGDMNGSTSKDRTNYFERLPTNQLDLALFLESDRMRSLDITKENLQNQISTVKEERRQGVDNQPYGKTMEAFDDLAYENVNYKHSVIGSMADLDAATVEDVQAFFRTYYAPDNAALVIVGDVKPAECLAKVRQYFESIPSQPPPPEPDMTEPAQAKEKRLTIDDPLARATRIDIGYHIPSGASPDYDALSVLGSVLSSGTSSRFTQIIVRQKQLALQAFAGPMESRGPGLFRAIGILCRPGKTAGRPRGRHLRGNREGQDGQDRGLGDREGAELGPPQLPGRPDQLAAAGGADVAVRRLLQRPEPDQHAAGPSDGGHRG